MHLCAQATVTCSSDEPPKEGTNLSWGDGSNRTVCTNISTSVNFFDLPVAPPPSTQSSGNTYTVWIRYTNGNSEPGDCNEYKTIQGCTIITDGSAFRIVFPTGTTMGDMILDGAFKIWVSIKKDGASTWEYWYQRVNGTGIYVLPVTWKEFTAKLNGTRVDLSWTVDTELNTSYYEVQRSANSGPFITLATKTALGTNGSPRTYTYTDLYPKAYNVYRIRAVDFDGKYSYSAYRGVRCDACETLPPPPPADCSSITINGTNAICGERETFTLSGLPSNSSGTTWSIYPSYAGQIESSNATSATVRRNGGGSLTLQAVINGCTDATKTRSKYVETGLPALGISIDNISYPYNATTYQLSARD